MTSFTPDKDAPMHRPVDMAPQPEYKSSKLISGSPIGLFEPVSLEIVDDASLSLLLLSELPT